MESDPKKPISKLAEGDLKQAVHGLFAKVQEKTGLDDKRIDEFQKKWLEVPETRTKYRHWWDATAIGGEELYAMFNDIIDFVQAQEVGQSHVFSSLREESEKIIENPDSYIRHVVGLGKGWMDRGIGWAKCWVKNEKGGEVAIPSSTKIEEASPEKEGAPEEELSDFERAELEDQKEEGGEEKEEREEPEEELSDFEKAEKEDQEEREMAAEKKPAKKPTKTKAKATPTRAKKSVAKKKGE
jgi:hypothetical protein